MDFYGREKIDFLSKNQVESIEIDFFRSSPVDQGGLFCKTWEDSCK